MNKKQVITAGVLAGALALTGVYGIHTAKAAESTTNSTFPPLIQKMVEKFNLNQDEVKTLMTQDREERQAEMKKDFSTKLDELVAAGKITSDQKDKIVAKHDELQTKMESLRDQNQDREAMHTQMEALHTEFTDYVKSLGVDTSLIPFGMGGKGHGPGGRGMGIHEGFRKNSTSATSN